MTKIQKINFGIWLLISFIFFSWHLPMPMNQTRIIFLGYLIITFFSCRPVMRALAKWLGDKIDRVGF